MNKTTGIAILLSILSLQACSSLFKKEISEQELQSQINKNFHIDKKIFLFRLKLTEPEIHLKENQEKFQLSAKIQILYRDKVRNGLFTVAGRPHWNRDEEALYLKQVEFTEFELEGSESSVDKIRRIVKKNLPPFLAHIPLYLFKGRDYHKRFFRSTLTKVEIKDKKVVLTFGIDRVFH